MLRRITRVFRNFSLRRRFDRDMAAEMRQHLDLHEQELRRQGLHPDQARRQARIDFGSVASAMESCRDARGLGRLDALWQDVRVGARRLRSAPVFTTTAVLSLALGFGANAVVFSALNGLLLAPLPFPSADRIAWVFSTSRTEPDRHDGVDSDRVRILAERSHLFSSLAVVDDASLIWDRSERFNAWSGLSVTTSLAEVLGIQAVAGRLPLGSDSLATPSIAISAERWRADFGGDPAIIGRRLHFADKKSFTVVAVLPAGLEFPVGRPPLGGTGSGFDAGVQDFWILNAVRGAEWPGGAVIGRATEDIPLNRLAVEVAAVRAAGGTEERTLSVVPMRDHAIGVMRTALPVLQGFALLVLVAACANLSALMMTRAAASRTDSAVRLALGAGMAHLTRLAAVEALLVCVLGSALGFAMALAGPSIFVALADGPSILVERMAPGAGTLALLLCLCACATLLLSWMPGRIRSSLPVITLLRDSGRAAMPPAARWLRPLVASQFALSLVLLAGAALLQSSLSRLVHVDAGYRPNQVLTADVLLYVPNAHVRLKQIYQQVRDLPGVETLGVVHSTPLTGKWSIQDTIEILDGTARRTTGPMIGSFVAFDYFGAMGIDLVAGRPFTEAEAFEPDPRAVILNDVAARAFFRDGHAVGRRLFMYGAVREVVGVVRATRDIRLDAAPQPQFYQPMFFGGSQIVLRVAGDPARFVEPVRRTLLASDPRLIVGDVKPLDAIVAGHVAERRLAAQLVSVFAALTVILAGIGLAGIVHFSSAARWREFGVRAALGATRWALVWQVVRGAGALVITGLAVGLPLAALGVRLLRPLLYGGPALDWPAVGMLAGLMLVVAAAACVLPAWRAGRIDPLTVIRHP